MRIKSSNIGSAFLFYSVFLLLPLSAWLTHVFTCLHDERWGFLIAGAIMFPIAIVHGFGIWLGVF